MWSPKITPFFHACDITGLATSLGKAACSFHPPYCTLLLIVFVRFTVPSSKGKVICHFFHYSKKLPRFYEAGSDMVSFLPSVPSTSTRCRLFVKHLSKYFFLDWQQAEHNHFSHFQPCMVALVARNEICPRFRYLEKRGINVPNSYCVQLTVLGRLAGHIKIWLIQILLHVDDLQNKITRMNTYGVKEEKNI